MNWIACSGNSSTCPCCQMVGHYDGAVDNQRSIGFNPAIRSAPHPSLPSPCQPLPTSSAYTGGKPYSTCRKSRIRRVTVPVRAIQNIPSSEQRKGPKSETDSCREKLWHLLWMVLAAIRSNCLKAEEASDPTARRHVNIRFGPEVSLTEEISSSQKSFLLPSASLHELN